MTDIKWGQHQDANQKELRNPQAHQVNGTPSTPVQGQWWYDTSDNKFKWRNNSGTIDPLARANHTGTQLSSTISDLIATVTALRLDQFLAPNIDLSMGSHKITNLTPGSGSGQAVEFDQMNTAVANAVAGMSWKTPARAGTTANIAALAGGAPSTIDGVALALNDRILVKSQSSLPTNGIYVVTTVGTGANGTWARATDADSSAELQGGVLIAVDEGTTLADTAWMLSADVATVGTNNVTWIPFGTGTTYTASLGVQLVGNDFRANLGPGLTLSGNTIVPDYTGSNVLKRKVATGFVGTSGVDITINHAFALANKADYIARVYEDVTGIEVQVGQVAVDTNNCILSFAVTPTTNQYRYTIIGLT